MAGMIATLRGLYEVNIIGVYALPDTCHLTLQPNVSKCGEHVSMSNESMKLQQYIDLQYYEIITVGLLLSGHLLYRFHPHLYN